MTRKVPPTPPTPKAAAVTITGATAAAARYPLVRVQTLLGLSRTVIRRLVDAGFVTPTRGPGTRLSFSFEDLVLLRSAHALIEAHVPPRRIVAALTKLKRSLPPDVPLTGLSLGVVGAQVVVRDRAGLHEAHSGQGLIDFELAPASATTLVLPGPGQRRATTNTRGGAAAARNATPVTAAQLLKAGTAAEAKGDAATAEAAYRQALTVDPTHLDARLNLGALLSDSGRSAQALPLYREALALGLDHALLHYNHAVALEDLGQTHAALAAYTRALALDAGCIDAHFNAGRLLEQLGDHRGALRHFNAYRRAQQPQPRGR